VGRPVRPSTSVKQDQLIQAAVPGRRGLRQLHHIVAQLILLAHLVVRIDSDD
jgi:hypothetical protein